MVQDERTWSVTFEAELPPPELWVRPGWEMAGPHDTKLPTFMRSIPKKKRPSSQQGLTQFHQTHRGAGRKTNGGIPLTMTVTNSASEEKHRSSGTQIGLLG